MAEGGFYVTLPCNASLATFPGNKISNYTTSLARTMNLKGEWEVGLIEFEYPTSWYTFNEEDAIFILDNGIKHITDHPAAGKEIEIFINGDQKTSNVLYRIKSGYYDDIVFLIREINANLPSGVSFGFDHVKNKVFLKGPPKTSLKFFGKLAIILGLKPGIAIETIPPTHDSHGIGHTSVMYAPHQADINGGFYTMYIYTDIIEYQSVGDYHVPLLRCVHIDGENNKIINIRYDRPHYVPVNKSSITEISIQVKDDQNQDISFSYGKVCAKLHFRPVKQRLF